MRGAAIAAGASDLLEELKRTKLFSERQFQVLRHPPSVFVTPKSWKELAELTGELGKPTLLGYLSEREVWQHELQKLEEKKRVRSLLELPYFTERAKEEGQEKLSMVTLNNDRFKYLDTRSENQKIADEVEALLEGKKEKTWSIAGTDFSWESQSQWFIDPPGLPDDQTDAAMFALAPGAAPSNPLKSWQEFRDKTAAEEIASFAEGESHETRASPDQVGED